MSDKITDFVPEPGTCLSWEIKKKELGEIPGNEEIIKQSWDNLDEYAYSFIWWFVQR
ncbi:MAG: hypothetical protein SCJ97_09800 [Bacillota bacterium]|nr:hypothetical protein [Bacillota bacterium]